MSTSGALIAGGWFGRLPFWNPLHYGAVLLIAGLPYLLLRREGGVVRNAAFAAVVLAAIVFDAAAGRRTKN